MLVRVAFATCTNGDEDEDDDEFMDFGSGMVTVLRAAWCAFLAAFDGLGKSAMIVL